MINKYLGRKYFAIDPDQLKYTAYSVNLGRVKRSMSMNDSSRLLLRIGARVRARRSEVGMSLRELAEASGVSSRFLSDVEKGRGNIAIGRLDAVAGALSVPLHTLVHPAANAPAIPTDRQAIHELLADCSEPTLRRLRGLLEVALGRRAPRMIALLGFRGAGKSTVGAVVAEALELPFVELVREVEDRAGMVLSDVFTAHGEGYYRRLEMECLGDLVASGRTCVAALPGGVVTNPDAMELIRQSCLSIWLRATPEDHWRRVFEQGDTRPMAGRAEPMAELRAIMARREPFYRQASGIVETSGRTLDEVRDAVLEALDGLGARSR